MDDEQNSRQHETLFKDVKDHEKRITHLEANASHTKEKIGIILLGVWVILDTVGIFDRLAG